MRQSLWQRMMLISSHVTVHEHWGMPFSVKQATVTACKKVPSVTAVPGWGWRCTRATERSNKACLCFIGQCLQVATVTMLALRGLTEAYDLCYEGLWHQYTFFILFLLSPSLVHFRGPSTDHCLENRMHPLPPTSYSNSTLLFLWP